MKVTAKRDQFSGHWWISIKGIPASIEARRAGKYDWYLCDVVRDGKSVIRHIQLDQKRNIVYPVLWGQFVPGFCSLRAVLAWVERVFFEAP